MKVQNDNPPPLSRRDFIGVTALGAVGLWSGTRRVAESPLLYVGTYTEGGRRDGIHLLRMDSGTGALRRVATVDAGPNPSFLAIDTDGQTLFAVNEVNELGGKPTGSLRSFAIDSDSGKLTLVNERESGGAAPCYVSTDHKGRVAMVANYVSGTVALVGIAEGGALTNAYQVVQHVGKGKNPARQEQAHAHCIIPHPSNRFALAADLGIDRVLVYRLDIDRGSLTHLTLNDAVMPPGTGPRHLAFHPTLPVVYVSGELNSTVSALRCDPITGALSPMQALPTLPASFTGENYPADIHVAPDGRALYVSNRGQNSIAVFGIVPATGMLRFQQTMPTGGDWPRNFTIDPTGRWLLVANQRSGTVVVFRRDAESGRLTATSHRIEVPSPVCLRFQSQAGTTT
ncbi:MAG: lactonase family protein [Gemmatimonadota bacterium]|nr:lactonase family protein [Gemmatimonadota bacterium]